MCMHTWPTFYKVGRERNVGHRSSKSAGIYSIFGNWVEVACLVCSQIFETNPLFHTEHSQLEGDNIRKMWTVRHNFPKTCYVNETNHLPVHTIVLPDNVFPHTVCYWGKIMATGV